MKVMDYRNKDELIEYTELLFIICKLLGVCSILLIYIIVGLLI
jgi:hypothetical protein